MAGRGFITYGDDERYVETVDGHDTSQERTKSCAYASTLWTIQKHAPLGLGELFGASLPCG